MFFYNLTNINNTSGQFDHLEVKVYTDKIQTVMNAVTIQYNSIPLFTRMQKLYSFTPYYVSMLSYFAKSSSKVIIKSIYTEVKWDKL